MNEFDQVIDRKGTGSKKWDFHNSQYNSSELIPMWVADMDFKSPPEVIKTLKELAEYGIYGYTERTDGYYQSVVEWLDKRYNWKIKKDWIYFTPGIVPALHLLVKTYTRPGDKVIIQSPVYYPFYDSIINNGCQVVNNKLKLNKGKYEMDFEDLINKIDKRVKMLILCSPHNPGGIVWEKDQLYRLGEICRENNILVVSDEIHADLTLKKYNHTPFPSLSKEHGMNCITCMAPSKTFNMAGLQVSHIIIENPELANKFSLTLEKHSISRPNMFAIKASEAAYRYGEKWLDNLLDYIEKNHLIVEEFVKEKISEIKYIEPNASYLSWLDFSKLGLEDVKLIDFLEKEARLIVTPGYVFGEGGEGFIRLNLGCSSSKVKEAMTRIEKAVSKIKK